MGTMQYYVMLQSFDGFGVPIPALHRVIGIMGAVGAQHTCLLKLWVLALFGYFQKVKNSCQNYYLYSQFSIIRQCCLSYNGFENEIVLYV